MAHIHDDDWEDVRLGRFDDTDENLVRRVMGARFFRPGRFFSSKTAQTSRPRYRLKEHQHQILLSRVNTIALAYDYTPRKQAVVKARSRPKSRQGVTNLIKYVARLRPQDKDDKSVKGMQVWDGYGTELAVDEVLALPRTWDLAVDNDNLSKRARILLTAGRRSEVDVLDERERLRNIQAWHFCFSIKENEDGMLDLFRVAARATVDKAFAAEGHEVIWAIHADHTDQMHAHVVVKAKSAFGHRIHSDIHGDYLHYLRETFASNLRRVGLDYEATRRIDREPMREGIASGMVPLRQSNEPWHWAAKFQVWDAAVGEMAVQSIKRVKSIRRLVRIATKDLRDAERTTAAANALRQELNRNPFELRGWRKLLPKSKKSTSNDNLASMERAVLRSFEQMYHNPRRALESWRLMASDGAHKDDAGKIIYPNMGLAIWMLCKRSEVFGFAKAEAYQLIMTRQLRDALKRMPLRKPGNLPKGRGAVPYVTDRVRAQAAFDRTSAQEQLSFLRKRVERTWPDTSWDMPIAKALRKINRIQLCDQPQIHMSQDDAVTVEKTIRPIPKFEEGEAKPKERSSERTLEDASSTKPINRTHVRPKGLSKGRER